MIKELLKDYQSGMSEFQENNFVINMSSNTVYGRYHQTLRETYKRLRGLREHQCDLEKLEIEIEEQEFLSKEEGFKGRYAAVELNRKIMQKEELERAISDIQKELDNLYKRAVEFKNILGELTQEKRDQLEKEMWIDKIKKLVVIDRVSTGRIHKNTYEMILSLPLEMRKVVFLEIQNVDKLIESYKTHEDPKLISGE